MLPEAKRFSNRALDGQKGKILLQISKTFKGDSRFKLDKRFQNDVDLDKLPEKFKRTLQNDIMGKVMEKTKLIKKTPFSLIITRFQPGTESAVKNIKKAEGRKKFVEGLIKSENKKNKKKIKKGISKIKKADNILGQQSITPKQLPKFSLQIKGNRKQAFQANRFKLFE